MFYSFDVLNIRSGKLGLTWLAATGRLDRLAKNDKHYREVMKTDIVRICDEILVHIQAGSIRRSPRRFSLYLSSMLVSGTAKLHLLQVKYLLDAVSEAHITLQTNFTVLKEEGIPGVTSAFQIGEEALLAGADTFFGALTLADALETLPFASVERDPTVSFVTPRKKEEAKRRKKPTRAEARRESEIQIERTARDGDDVTDLLLDWVDPLQFPHTARIQDITLLEEVVQESPLKVPLGNLDLGPPTDEFLAGIPLYEVPIEKPTPPPQPVEEIVQQPPISEDITKETGAVEEFPPLETPVPPRAHEGGLEEPPGPPLRRKKRKAQTEDDVTCLKEAEVSTKPPPERDENGQMILEEVMAPEPRIRAQKKKRKFYDEDIYIRGVVLKEQMYSYSDTMRETKFHDDVINVTWWTRMKATSHLLHKTERVSMSTTLQKMITRHYKMPPPGTDFFDWSRTAQRALQLQEDVASAEKARHHQQSLLENISGLSSIHLDASKTSATDKSSSFLETPAVMPPPPPSTGPLHPIPEEHPRVSPKRRRIEEPISTPSQGFAVPQAPKPTVLFPPEEVGAPEAQEELPLALAILKEGEERRWKKRKPSPDPGFQKVTVEADVHVEGAPAELDSTLQETPAVMPPGPPSGTLHPIPEVGAPEAQEELPLALAILKEGEERRWKKRKPSPDTGFQKVTVEADIHVEGAPAEVEREILFLGEPLLEKGPVQPSPLGPVTKGPYPPQAPLAPDFSPVRGPARGRVGSTPEASLQLELDVVDQVQESKRITFDQLLPRRPTRRDVASILATILELHKKRRIRVNQDEAYGPIIIVCLE